MPARFIALKSSHSATMSDAMMRHLLGSEKQLIHDPGPKGESGEGDACLVLIFLCIAASILVLIYGELQLPAHLDSAPLDASCAQIPD